MLSKLPDEFAFSEQKNSKLKSRYSRVRVQHPLVAEYLTTAQLAEVLGTSVSVIKQSRMTGLLFGRPSPEFIRIGERKLLYKTSVAIEWIESGKRGRIAGAEL